MIKRATGENGEFILKKLLLLPMQRLTQYSLLIDKLIKYIPKSDESEINNLQLASKQIVDLMKSINNEIGKKDDQQKLEWLEEHINVKSIVSQRTYFNFNFNFK